MNRWAACILGALLCGGCSSEQQNDEVQQLEVTGCDAAVTECSGMIDGMQLSLSLGPDVVALKPFPVRVTFARGQGVDGLLIDFQMTGMEMGLNRYRLQHEEGVWQGMVTLPVCTASRTDWQATIAFESQGKAYRILFPFTVQ